MSIKFWGFIQMAGKAKQTKESICIGLRIKKIRKKKKISSGDFAKIMSTDGPSISNWEAGRAAFPAHQLFAIAKKLGVTPEWLLTGRQCKEYQEECHE